MKNILITGGAGFIGSNFINFITQRKTYNNIFNIDKLTYAGNLNNISKLIQEKEIIFYEEDICNTNFVSKIISDNNISLVVNFAAESHVDRSIKNPSDFVDSNINGTFSLLEASMDVWKKNLNKNRFHHISTDEVYGELGLHDESFHEDTPYAPRSPYAASKAASDHLVRAYYYTYGLPISISNCSNNFGPFQNKEKLIPLVITNIRDWLYVDDHCEGVLSIINSDLAGETYNIGGYNEKENLFLVKLICDLIDTKFENNNFLKEKYHESPISNSLKSEELIKFVDDRLGHDKRYAINASKIERKLKFKPKTSFETGILKTVEWYVNNEYWWRH
jgi:dTDP-glucose 4,6-dehydratase